MPWHTMRADPARRRGFGLVELLVALAVLALTASLAYPSMRGIVLRVHRSEALAMLANVQLLQARHRSNHPVFGSLAQLGIATAGRRYRLAEDPAGATGYAVMAIAEGMQAADRPCSHLLLAVVGNETRWASGVDSQVANGDDDNRRCWGR